MDFLVALALYASSHNISEAEMMQRHTAYCQNLYWQPDALEKMQVASCDIGAVSAEIARVKSGTY